VLPVPALASTRCMPENVTSNGFSSFILVDILQAPVQGVKKRGPERPGKFREPGISERRFSASDQFMIRIIPFAGIPVPAGFPFVGRPRYCPFLLFAVCQNAFSIRVRGFTIQAKRAL